MIADENLTKECRVYVVQYVPDLVRGELINIGLLLHSPRENYLGCLFMDDFRRVSRFHPHADLMLLRALQEDFEKQIENAEDDLENYVLTLRQSYSNLIQLAEPRTCRLADPQGELANLFVRYVGERRAAAQAEDTRLRIKQKLTAALSLAGVWTKLEKRIPAARWTQPDDAFAFDYGYRPLRVNGQPNGHLHFIHALSLRRDVELAKVLVYTLDRVRRKGPAHLTAVVEALAARGDKAAGLSQRIMEDGEVELQPVAGLAEYAQRVRAELMF